MGTNELLKKRYTDTVLGDVFDLESILTTIPFFCIKYWGNDVTLFLIFFPGRLPVPGGHQDAFLLLLLLLFLLLLSLRALCARAQGRLLPGRAGCQGVHG